MVKEWLVSETQGIRHMKYKLLMVYGELTLYTDENKCVVFISLCGLHFYTPE